MKNRLMQQNTVLDEMERLLAVFFLVTCVTRVDGSSAAENQLYTDLMTNYNRELLPRCNASDKVTVTLDIALREVVNMNEREQTLRVKLWIRQIWNDCALQWTPSNYSGISVLSLYNNKVWIPDITLYESAYEGEDMPGRSSYRIYVYSDGSVYFNFPTLATVTCLVDVTYFPYDTQKCTFKLGSWTYHGLQVDVQQKNAEEQTKATEKYTENEIIKMLEFLVDNIFVEFGGQIHDKEALRTKGGDLSSFEQSNEWNVESLKTKRHVLYYGCCPEPYPDVTFTLTLKRKPKFYVLTILFPCVLVLALAALGFILPSDSGEKVSLEVTVLLSLSVFLLLVSDKLPPSSESFPHIGVYFSVSMMIVCLSCVLSVIILYLHFRDGSTTSVPSWARRVFLQTNRSLLCDKSKIGTVKSNKVTLEDINENIDEDLEGFHKRNAATTQNNKTDMEELTEEAKLDEWRELARVLDRIFFIVYIVISVIITIVFIAILVSQS